MSTIDHLTEPAAISDIFVEGIGQIAKVSGDCLRFTLYATRDYGDGEVPERIIVAQLIWPKEALRLALAQTANAMQGLPFIDDSGLPALLC